MSKDYKVETWGKGNYIVVVNYPNLNEIVNVRFTDKKMIKNQIGAIGYWKPKNK